MDNKTMLALLNESLTNLGFKNYGPRLFYIEYDECILVLEQITYMMAAELYLKAIIKSCHPEIKKITKSIITNKMYIDTFKHNRLQYKQLKKPKCSYDLYDIPVEEFNDKIKEMFDSYILPFKNNFIYGIDHYNNYVKENDLNHSMDLFIDSAEMIGRPDLAGEKGHDWFLTDRYQLLFEYNVDVRYVNENTERYIMENVIKNIPKDLKRKAISKWCNQQCKEIFLMKGKRFFLGWGVLFPFVNGKPLKYCGCNVMPPNNYQIYYNEDTKETFHYKRVKDENGVFKWEIVKV